MAAGVVLLVALAVRVGFVFATPHYQLVNDSFDYQRIAVSVAGGHGFGQSVVAPGGGPSAFRPPLYPLSLGAFYRVAGVNVRAARLAQALLGVVTVALVGLVAGLWQGRRLAFVAAGMAALYPPLVLDGGALLSESLAVPLELGAVAAAMMAKRAARPERWAILSGLLAGLGVLNRPNTAVLVIVFALVIGIGPGRRRAAAALVAVAGLTLVPWLVRDARAFHHVVPLTTQTGIVMSGTYNLQADHDHAHPAAFRPANLVPDFARLLREHPHMGELEEERRFRALAVHYVHDHPTYPFKVAFWNTARLFDLTGPQVAHAAARAIGFGPTAADVGLYSYCAVAALALVGVVGVAGARSPVRRWPVWLVPVGLVVSTVFLQGETRMRAGIEPFVILLAALALDRLAGARLGDRLIGAADP